MLLLCMITYISTLFMLYNSKNKKLPGQRIRLHSLVILFEPSHALPPYIGVTLSHCRVRLRIPCPQITVHLLHAFHGPQSASTDKIDTQSRVTHWLVYIYTYR